ncbi:hypothetical protein AYM40_19535 [Paraburkholderia phytofirmans OLGA172]|uniref:Uncharacterized protein n=1 Tax=Paraburkholderia phytofirmans OLGA172 TaxID=1417228 RepID=A0A160FPH0_9BURK|nr:hypothetical protein [Paraburkholderia phytofirmans]ANB74316.1 hypothetical protein AYM40_19535 [Paraburkholderia phytofirmans OLGA172]
MLPERKVNWCCRANTAANLLTIAIFSIAASACTPGNDALTVIPIDPAPSALLFAKLVSGPHTYRFVFSTNALTMIVDTTMAKRDLKQLTQSECKAQDCANDSSMQAGASPEYYWLPPLKSGQWALPEDSAAAAFDYRQIAAQYGQIDGLLGLPAITTLNWLWNRGAGTMSGYRYDSQFFSQARDALVCTAMEMIEGGKPAIQLEVGGQREWFVLDTSADGRLSGNLSRTLVSALRSGHGVAAEVMFSPPAPSGQSWRHALLKPKSMSLAGIRVDGLAFDEADGRSTLGIGFLYKLDKAAFDFANHRFCVPASTRVKPDPLPTQAELDRLAASARRD